MKNKNRKNKCNNETTQMLLCLPQNFAGQCMIDGVSQVLNKFSNAGTAEEQIVAIRSLSAYLNNDFDENIQLIVTVLSHLFVNASPKSTVKKSILRTFASSTLQSHISLAISKQLLEKMKTVSLEQTNLKLCNDCVSAVNDCFDNCPSGIVAISLVLRDVFDFLINFLQLLVNELSVANSPLAVQELHQYIHNCTRGFVAISQQCDIECALADDYTDVIFKYCVKVLNNADVSFDTKNNCGIILVTAANCSMENGYTVLLRMCLDNDIVYWNINSDDITDDMTVTCIFSGILNVVKAEELCKYDGTVAANALSVMCERLLLLAQRSAGNPPAILGVNRSLLLVSRALAPLSSRHLIQVAGSLLDHVWTQLDHHVDTIRHVAKTTLVHIAKLAKNRSDQGDSDLLTFMVDCVLLHISHTYRSTRYRALAVISQEAGCSVLLTKQPHLVLQLVQQLQDESTSTYVISCYEHLMRGHLKETDEPLWFNTWVLPLISELSNVEALDKKGSCVQSLLITAVKLRPTILDSILSRWSTDNEVHLSLLLKCTLIARTTGSIAKTEDSQKWRGLLNHSVLNLAMCYQHDEVRIASLSLIAETQKTTEIFNEWELKFIVTFLRYNINTQLPSTRQSILAIIKKILNRFSDSYYSILRDFHKLPDAAASDSKCLRGEQKTQYERFAFELRNCVLDSLFPGANFSRRIICLEILTLMEPILAGVLKSCNLSPGSLWKRSEAEAILLCLSDSYESNNKLAAALLERCPPEMLNLHTALDTRAFIQKSLTLAASVKPAETVTAAYMLETAMYSPVLKAVLLQLLSLEPTETDYTLAQLVIRLLLNELLHQVETGKHNLLRAAATAPMHGTLFCLRHLMEKYLFSCNPHDSNWSVLVAEIIDTCFQVNEIVGPVVNNTSPEGHLPMDQEACTEDQTTTAQMLLVCSWRSVKEVSLLLGEITLRLSVQSGEHGGLVSEDQMLRIGEHFTVLLTETKHRGAFEQAYVGFAKLCTRLWKCSSGVLHQLPVVWLTDIMNAIGGKTQSNNKLCATRRSAGVPFMIQAIVSSELQCGSSTNFHQCMDRLLRLANTPSDHVEVRTHAMNVLRAMYRHTQLGEVVTPYVAQGIMVAVLGFSRTSWAERNAATLLFSSLMTRIFGVQRSRDTEQLSIRNRMTARVFFLCHPALHAFLLDQLRQLTGPSCALYKELALYPILLLLARLYPSTSEQTSEASNELEGFVPYVRMCADNRVLKTRELAAKALVPLVPTTRRKLALVAELFGKLTSEMGANQNYLHGILLQILYLLRAAHPLDKGTDAENWLRAADWIMTCTKSSGSAICASTYMQIIILLTTCRDKVNLHSTFWRELLSAIDRQDEIICNSFIIGKTMYQRTAVNVQFHLLINLIHNRCDQIPSELSSFLFSQLAHPSTDVQEFTLNFLICCLKTRDTGLIIDNLEIPVQEKNLADSILPQSRIVLVRFLEENVDALTEKLVEIIKCDGRLCGKAMFALSCYLHASKTFATQNGSDLFTYFKEKLYSELDDVSSAALCCIRTIFNSLNEGDFDRMNLDDIFDIFLEFSTLNNAVSCRYIVALILSENAELLFGQREIKYDYLVMLWRTVMQLLEDSEPVVRSTISTLSRSSVTAEKCREDLLCVCVENLKLISEHDCAALLLFWALVDRDPYASDDDDIEGQVFEKGEVNTYVESMCLSKLSAKMLKELICSDDIGDIPSVFQKIVSILNSDTKLFENECQEKDKFTIVLQEIMSEFEQENTDAQMVFTRYFIEHSCSRNTWHGLNPMLKYKTLHIVQNVVREHLKF